VTRKFPQFFHKNKTVDQKNHSEAAIFHKQILPRQMNICSNYCTIQPEINTEFPHFFHKSRNWLQAACLVAIIELRLPQLGIFGEPGIMIKAERPVSISMSFSQASPENIDAQRPTSNLSRAVFIDRDGTLNLERGYITDPAEIKLYPDAGAVLQSLHLSSYMIVIISNQSAIGQGLMTEDRFEQVNQALWDQLRQLKSGYDALYYCPHTPQQQCECRKPKPGLVLQAALDFNIDLSASYLIGDKLSDIEAGKRAGCRTILVLTGRGSEAMQTLKQDNSIIHPDTIQASLSAALTWIQKNEAPF
jgi:D,D-heptose 1,7-bisphosphate phosphatase